MDEQLNIQRLAGEGARKGKKSRSDKYLKRLSSKSLYKDIGKVMENKGIGSPAEYLANLMAGDDPRYDDTSLLDIIDNVRDRGLDELPTFDEWLEICEIVSSNAMYAKRLVPIEHSTKAAETLSKYLYSQKSEAKNQTELKAQVEIAPLTKKEIKKFKKIFEGEF